MSAELFLEIRCEELPARFLAPAMASLESGVRALLGSLPFGALRVWGSPRRLAVSVTDLALARATEEKVITGPPESAAFKDGKPTPAAEGFARRYGPGRLGPRGGGRSQGPRHRRPPAGGASAPPTSSPPGWRAWSWASPSRSPCAGARTRSAGDARFTASSPRWAARSSPPGSPTSRPPTPRWATASTRSRSPSPAAPTGWPVSRPAGWSPIPPSAASASWASWRRTPRSWAPSCATCRTSWTRW
ncbi:MAG: glycine--tRNA ligase subunit beta [Planctomycetes bacterium]|nr:glycine--tRNA ligase subunit beta [Planctomycetota bacterium]